LNQIKIAIVSQPFDGVLPPYQNSIGIWSYEMARKLADEFDVTVYLKGGGRGMQNHIEEGVCFRQVTRGPDHLIQKIKARLPHNPSLLKPTYAASTHYAAYAFLIAQDLRRRGCELVHVLNFSQFVPIIRALNPNIRIVLNMRCEWLSQLDPKMIARRLAKTDLIVGCSNHVTNEVRKRFPDLNGKTHTVPNAIDTSRFTPTVPHETSTHGGNPRLLFVGRVSPEKGVHVLVEAMAEVVAAFPEAHLDIVGGHMLLPYEFLVGISHNHTVASLANFYRDNRKDSYIAYLKERILQLGLQKHVTMTGLVPYADVLNYYRAASLLVNPSFSESFGRSPVEAMACGVPVVGTQVGGMRDTIVDGENGRWVTPGDVEALAGAVLDLLGNEQLCRKMGRAGRERAENLFSWESVATEWREVYRRELKIA
jgi:glycosyltransferase involved in cell wall biosynthesis